uniref:zinc finger and BTB domain-containing protein 41-like n=1 Tax=Styela clava TaxID=7725 RepID=UPI00193A4DD5|nr:zinc finger and BTB domain-containing protein 41-like [Styela clava]
MSVTAIQEHGQHGRILDAFAPFPSAISHPETICANAMSPPKDSEIQVDENNNEVVASPPNEHPPPDWSEDSGSCSMKDDEHSTHEEDSVCRERNCSGAHSDSIDVEISDEGSTNQDDDGNLIICEENEEMKEKDQIEVKNDPKRKRFESENFAMKSEFSENIADRRSSSEYFSPANSPQQSTTVRLDGFSHYFAHNLHTMHRRDLFCDVTIKAHDSLLHGHKVVLAACSPYFYNVLEKRNASPHRKDLNIGVSTHSFIDLGKSVSPIGLEQILDGMYSSRISLHRDTVHDVLEAATFLNMQLVVDVCYKFIDSEQMKAEEKFKTSTNQENEQQIRKADFVESPIDLTALSKRNRRTSNSADDKSESKSDLETVDSAHSSTTYSRNNTTPDPEDSTIYQRVSHKDHIEPKTVNPKSMNWKKYKLITQNRSEQNTHSNYGMQLSPRSDDKQTRALSPRSPRHDITDESDDVFIKKEPTRSTRLSTDSATHDFRNATSRLESHSGNLTADLIRRHQRDLYQHVISNSPYAFSPETMAAAMAMTTLTSPTRPSTTKPLPAPRPERPPFGISPWQHFLGQRLQNSVMENPLLRSSFSGIHTHAAKSHHDVLQEQKQRQQAFLNLAGSAHRYVTERFVPQNVPEFTHIRESPGKPSGPTYSPLLLTSLLQQSTDTAPHHAMKRTFSSASGDSHGEFSAPHAPKRLTPDHQPPFFTENSRRFVVNTIKSEIAARQQKQRRSTTSSAGSPDRPYKCLVCAAEFNRPANLKTHMRIHSGEKPYKCQSCGARFVQVAHLRAHILIHTGEKPYPCKVCGTRFRHLQTLKSHLRIHTGEKPYACEECQVRFRHKSQLRLHLRTKHGINTNTKKTYQQVPGLRSADISAHIKRTQEAVRMQAHKKEFCEA